MTRLEDDPRLPRAVVDVAPEKRALMKCMGCRATFLRGEVAAPEKGTLVCPECGSGDVRDVPDIADRSG